MDYDLKKKTSNHTNNKYETVIVASKIARKLNMERLAESENIGADEQIPAYRTKVTVEALNALAEGKIKFKIREDKSREEDIYSEI